MPDTVRRQHPGQPRPLRCRGVLISDVRMHDVWRECDDFSTEAFSVLPVRETARAPTDRHEMNSHRTLYLAALAATPAIQCDRFELDVRQRVKRIRQIGRHGFDAAAHLVCSAREIAHHDDAHDSNLV